MFRRRADWTLVAGLVAVLMVTSAQATSMPKPTVAGKLVALYVPMQEALAGDSVAAVKEQAAAIALKAAEAVSSGGDNALYGPIEAAAQGMTASDIDGLREQFKRLSLALAHLVEKVAVLGHGIYYCPMVDAYWIQKTGEIHNPYYGKQMSSCGEQVTKVED